MINSSATARSVTHHCVT